MDNKDIVKVNQSIETNICNFEKIIRLNENFDILKRIVYIADRKVVFYFIDGFVKEDMAEKLMQFFYSLKPDDLKDVDTFLEKGMPYTEAETETDMEKIVTGFLSGVTVCFIDGFEECIMMDYRTYPIRSVEEPWKDKVLRGSRDGFVETLVMNAALIRRRIRDPLLSIEMMGVGSRSRSDVAICYIADKVDRKLLDSICKKIKNIEVEALTMNIESLAECLYEHKWVNPFPKFKYSERPDTAAAAVLDGNIVIMVDNSPAVMIIPTSIFDMLEEADDFYFSPVVGTYMRLSRFLITFITVLLTPVWLLFMNNPSYVPEWLSFITITDDITVPVFLQLLLLELAVDGLKLAAVNTPDLLSTPLSILASIMVGEYAVSTGWFNGEALLYMAVVTLGTYSQASFDMGFALKFSRIFMLVITQILDLSGFIIGIIALLLIIGMNTTLSGQSYIYPLVPFNASMLKRKIFRIRLPHGQKNNNL